MTFAASVERPWEVTKRGDVWLWHCGSCHWFEGGYPERQEAVDAVLSHVEECKRYGTVDKAALTPAGYFNPFDLRTAEPTPWSIKVPLADVPVVEAPEVPQKAPGAPETLAEKAQRLGIDLIDMGALRREGRR